MAELTAPATTGEESAAFGCCAPAAPAVQETCCEPSEKSPCCGTSAAGGTCGCAHGERAVDPPHHAEGAFPMAELTDIDIREQVRERYAGHAKLAIDVSPGAARRAEEACCVTTGQSSQFGDVLYDADSRGKRSRGRGVARLRRPDRGRRPE
jgi:arsenite methyltransferase